MNTLNLSILCLLSLMVLCPVGAKADCDDDSDDTVEIAVAREAIRQHYSVDLALAVARVESGMKQSARGARGEIGVFQIMPYNSNGLDLLNGRNNIRRGIELLKQAAVACSDMGKYYIICYNSGPRKRPNYPNKHPYYLKVTQAMP